MISDFRVMGDQRELFGPVASVPTAWRALKEAAAGGDRALEGVACIRLDATVVPAHSDKELAEANFKGFGHHPLLAACDNTASRWPGCSARAQPEATPPPITCGCSARRSARSRRRCAGG